MERLLCIVGGMNAGGAETFLMKIYRHLDKEKYQMDFCVSKAEKGFYDDEILSMGGRILHTTAKSKNPFAYVKNTYDIVKGNNYNRVMRISQHSLSAVELLIAWLAGAKVRVFRSSNSQTMKAGKEKVLHNIFMFLPRIISNVKIAPSYPAAEFMFGKKAVENGNVLFLNNGIPLRDYAFDETERDKVRAELGLEGKFIIGHIGRFTTQKNHTKLLTIFCEIKKLRQNAVLMLIGEGELREEIESRAVELDIGESVLFLGVRKDIGSLLSAMDVFVFPSLYEGMPNTIIEAQANGLPCVMSDTITSDAIMCVNVFAMSLDADAETWAHKIVVNCTRVSSAENADRLKKCGYDIEQVCSQFEQAVFLK